MKSRKKYCFFNGKVGPISGLKISPYDLGILRGYGVFDVMCARNSKPFLLEEHWKRLQNSAGELGLRIPLGEESYKKMIGKLLELNGFKRSIVRTVLTGGEAKDGFTPDNKETFYVLIEKLDPLPRDVFVNGAKVITLEYLRDIPQAKITNYVAAIKNWKKRDENKALEIVYVKDGEALEASTSNLFIFKNGVLATPKNNILLGITRNLIVNLAKSNNVEVQERKVLLKELYSADEALLTATNKGIVPVVEVDGKKIGGGKVGENTKVLMGEFKKFVDSYYN